MGLRQCEKLIMHCHRFSTLLSYGIFAGILSAQLPCYSGLCTGAVMFLATCFDVNSVLNKCFANSGLQLGVCQNNVEIAE